jgi:hypothetical protein
MANGKGPLAKVNAGAGIVVSIWENEMPIGNGQSKTVLKASIEKRYKAADGQWKSTSSFDIGQLGRVQWAISQAMGKMIAEANPQERNGAEEEVVE